MVIPVVLEQRLGLAVLSGSDPRPEAALVMCFISHFPYRHFHCIVLLLPSLRVAVVWTLESQWWFQFVMYLVFAFRVLFSEGGGGGG